MTDARRLETLTRGEALGLLAGARLGRVVFTHLALPAIRPVNHLVEGDRIIIRARHDAAIVSAADTPAGIVVAYEADTIDPDDLTGWSVSVVGRARLLPGSEAASRYQAALRPWAAGSHDDIIVIQADMVDGFRIVRDGTGRAGGPR